MVKVGFVANPTGGPGIFLSRLKTELESLGCFDVDAPDVWIQLCYERLPERVQATPSIKRLIRTDGVYALRHRLFSKPVKLDLPPFDALLSRARNQRRNRMIRDNLRSADGIVFQSVFSREATHRFVTDTPPGLVIPNGADTALFSPAPGWKRDSRKLNVLISHAFRPHKRLHEAVRIIAALQRKLPGMEICLHVLGSDDGLSFEYARRIIAREKLEDCVRFWGKQPFNRLQEFYRMCDFAFGLSFWDFCPNVIVEALCCGLPVLGVNFGGIPELVGDAGRLVDEPIKLDYQDLYDFGRLPATIPEQYAEQALLLLENLEDYRAKARERALAHLDIRQTARQYLNACAQTLSQTT